MSRSDPRRIRRRRLGANAMEFALLMPVFLAVIGGIIEFGWFQQRQAIVNAATRRAARVGMAAPVTADPVAEASAELTDALAGNGLTATSSTIELRGLAPDQVIYVEAEVAYAELLGLVPLPAVHRTSASMRLEVQGR